MLAMHQPEPVPTNLVAYRPRDIYSTDGRILQRGTIEVELADEFAGKFDRFYDPTNPADEHYLTLNLYAVVPGHPNGCGRVLIPGCSAVTFVPADTPSYVLKQLLNLLADRLETYGVDPITFDADAPPDMGFIVEQLAFVNPQWSSQ